MLVCCGIALSAAYGETQRDKGRTAGRQEPSRTDQTAKSGIISKDPYLGALVMDAATGNILFEDRPDVKGYPASITKLMVLLIYLEGIESKRIHLHDPVTVTAEAARIGGSQVYLKEGEVFTVEDLLYATIVQSGNDAATALAIHYAGDKAGFVHVMNQRAQELGMKDTVFHSVHGLPPARDQLPDVSTPRDLARLSRELLRHPRTLPYTATRERPFRPDAPEPFIMRSHNHLLTQMEGCDGLKTGYFLKGGFSIAATASKNGVRAVAVVLGSAHRKVRDAKARELLSKALMELAAKARTPAPAPAVQPVATVAQTDAGGKTGPQAAAPDTIQIRKRTLTLILAVMGVGILLFLAVLLMIRRRKRREEEDIIHLDP